MKFLTIITFALLSCAPRVSASIEIDRNDEAFFKLVTNEIEKMRSGGRGLVCQTLVERLDAASVATLIRPVTSDEATWHPNDKRGTRSHLVIHDTKIQGAERRQPTAATIYVHPSRVDPNLSLFKLGTLVYFLALSADLNTGSFPGDYRTRERRATFFSNAWRDSFGYSLLSISDNVSTPDYTTAKDAGLINPDQKENFPLIQPAP